MQPRATALFLLVFFLFSCQQTKEKHFSPDPQVTADLDAIKKRGVLTALVDNNSFSYFIYKGRPMGYEYELLKLLAKHLNVDLKIKVISGVDNGISQLNDGGGDILAFPLTVTKERTGYVNFT